MDRLSESNIEKAATDWLKEQGYRYVHGSEIERPLNKVVLEKDLMHFISKTYSHLPEINRKEVLQQLILQDLKTIISFALTNSR